MLIRMPQKKVNPLSKVRIAQDKKEWPAIREIRGRMGHEDPLLRLSVRGTAAGSASVTHPRRDVSGHCA